MKQERSRLGSKVRWNGVGVEQMVEGEVSSYHR